ASSFNRITVDGDMSTNDTVLALANGLAGNPLLSVSSKSSSMRQDLRHFQEALDHVCLELAKMLVRDGEGVSRFATVFLEGARNDLDADLALRSVCNSALVKTSWLGGDPNWGRILDALGYSQATIDPMRVDIAYSASKSSRKIHSLRAGKPSKVAFKTLCELVAGPEIFLHINLNLGKGRGVMYASDLTEDYVTFNKGDVSDPASLGG
ncbi:MAG: bifunctional ornithine acetyltransferase/N-acetylglutamate synthase, partial [Verrucomicrobiota bacterium]